MSINYRVSGLGFLASKEVKAAGVGNLGLQDRESLVLPVLRTLRSYYSGAKRATGFEVDSEVH